MKILSYYKEGEVIKNRKSILIKYLKIYFIIDFISLFPYYFG